MNSLKTAVGMAILFVLFMSIGRLFGGRMGMEIGLLIAFVMNVGAYWFSDSLALSMSGAVAVSESEAPELYRMVRKLSETAKIPMPRLYRIPVMQPNAFATGRDPEHSAIAVTDGICRVLPPLELEGVLAHELTHIKNRDTLIATMAATMAGAIGYIAQMLQFQAIFGGRSNDDDDNIVGIIAAMILVPIVSAIIQLSISRAREYEADRGSALITGNPLGLARALDNIENVASQAPLGVANNYSHMYIINPNGGDLLKKASVLFRTHPVTEDRIARLEKMAAAMKQ